MVPLTFFSDGKDVFLQAQGSKSRYKLNEEELWLMACLTSSIEGSLTQQVLKKEIEELTS